LSVQCSGIAVAIIEDQWEIREGLRTLIEGAPGYACVGRFGSVEEALEGLAARCPDVILIDIGLPGMSGIDGIPRLRELCPVAQFLVLTVYDDDDRIFSALCAGASGYLLKKIQLFRDFRTPQATNHELTPHEIRLLKLLAEGHNYKTAARELNASVNTISFHMKHIYEKLHVHSKSQAVAKALRAGIVR
jgi:DNA-binding NarL/FixJ family response regulator